MTTNTALKDEMELATARKALKEMTPEQLLKLNAAAQELAAARKEIEEIRKRSLGDHSTAMASVVDRRQIFEQLKEALEMFFPGVEFTYERSYLAQRLANDVTFLGRNKLRRKRGVLARVNRAMDQDLDGIRQEYGIEIPRTETQRSEESLSTINESLVRCKALQQASIVYFETLSGLRWQEPPEMNNDNNRQSRRGMSPDARSYHPREVEDSPF